MIKFKGKYHDELNFFISGPIQNDVLTITSGNPSCKICLEIKPQSKIYLSDQSFEKQEKELIKFMEKYHDELRKF